MGHGSKNDPLQITSMKRGTVVDNDDPDQSGQVRVKVHEIMDGVTDNSSIPWAKPLWPAIIGAGAGTGIFGVPDVGTEVYVVFENGDPLLPIYIGEAADGVHGQPALKNYDNDYPNVKGIRFANGFEIYLNQTKDIFKISHPAGTFVEINGDGKITISTPDEIDVLATQAIQVTSALSAKVTAPDITLEATNVNVNADYIYSTVTGNVSLDVSGEVIVSASQVTIN